MKVLKFGGSSVGSAARIQQVLDILKSSYARGDKFCVVFSAMSGVTDRLLALGRQAAAGDSQYLTALCSLESLHVATATELLSGDRLPRALEALETLHQELRDALKGVLLVKEASPRTLDLLASFGERTAAWLIALAMEQQGLPARFLDARTVIRTDDRYGDARVDFKITNQLLAEHFARHPEIQVITGFIGSAPSGNTTTLGRGGSDYTAAIVGAALRCSSIEIWTDVDGVLTADPRKVPNAFSLPQMTYAEAMEMSHFGAKVIYPPTLQPALALHIPLVIKNTFNPEHPGTAISTQKPADARPVRGISSVSKVSLLTLQGSGMQGVLGIAARLFGALSQAQVNVILITQGSSEQSISFAVAPEATELAKSAVENAFSLERQAGLIEPLKLETEVALVAIVGEGMRTLPGIAGRMFSALGRNGINCMAIAQGSSELNVSVAIPRLDETKALNALHQAFFLSDHRELNLFVVGTGTVGKALLQQLKAHAAHLQQRLKIDLRLVGLANSKSQAFDAKGLALDAWETTLAKGVSSHEPAAFVRQMKQLNLPNSIFVDCTASALWPLFYEDILDGSISISTPNKLAMSSSLLQYQRLKQVAQRRGVSLGYETNVGAGLPVLTTLNDLLLSGDRISKLEGVLSGSMSFVFNQLGEGVSLSSLIRKAQQQGYTEPDPREDLSGKDVRRKLLILAREAGLELEEGDVRIAPFLREQLFAAPTVDAFFQLLPAEDAAFEERRKLAAEKKQVLRLVAKLEAGQASIGVEAFDAQHPFAALQGSENMLVFTTERYAERPLVVRGPGAGAAVTAAGVFAEILRIGSRFYASN